ncbi:S24 family peptidase [Emticicia sp. C21]|uniref:S24 family peptidase n=1 Tax=Emticicia sp. C21 TaxID=2302915 RepID=UPI000E34D523|nr:S24 family peptidase [Emticicia sp. C21]RFS16092.1 hypothetical protein D0T08_14480 [Emticicia sp. C21]
MRKAFNTSNVQFGHPNQLSIDDNVISNQANESELLPHYAIYPVYGESMSPRYKPGDRVIVKEYPHFFQYIRYGEVYFIFTKNEERILKRIRKSDREGFIKLTSINPDYDDFEVPLSHITKIFIVTGIVSIEN